jgi:hypothetical protein
VAKNDQVRVPVAGAGGKTQLAGRAGKTVVGITLGTIGLTLVLYLLAYYFLPSGSPSPAVVSLFAFLAVCTVYGIRWIMVKKK